MRLPEARHFDANTPWDLPDKDLLNCSNPPASDIFPTVYMYQPIEEDFPPLSSFTKGAFKHTPKVANSTTSILPTGQTKPTSAAEEVLNWQTKNAVAQNKLLPHLDSNMTQVTTNVSQVSTQVQTQTKQVTDLIRALQHRLDTLKFDIPDVDFRTYVAHLQAKTAFMQNTIANLKATCSLPLFPKASPLSPTTFSLLFQALYLQHTLNLIMHNGCAKRKQKKDNKNVKQEQLQKLSKLELQKEKKKQNCLRLP